MLSRKFYIKDILTMALPIMMGNIGFIMIGVGDVVVAGRHSTDTLAAISLANAIINCIMMLGIGILSSISSILSNYRGGGTNPIRFFGASIKFAFLLSIPVSLIIFGSIPIISKLGFDSGLTSIIKDYFFVTGFATFGAYLHCASKEYLQSYEIVVFPNIVTIFCIFLNLILNYIFVFGVGFSPEMGAIGIAVSTLLTRYFMGIVLFLYCLHKNRHLKDEKSSCKNFNSYKKYYNDLIKVGLPASLAILIEFVGFNSVAVILGRVSGIYAAAHTILCTITSISFMIPFSFSIASSVKVGFANGAKYYKSLQKYAWTSIAMCVSFMALSAITIAVFANPILHLFSTDESLIQVCMPIMILLCAFQIFDGLQVALSGIFRGIKKTKNVMISNFIGYWLISLPLGCYLGLKHNMNLLGFWYGIGIGAMFICTKLLIDLIYKFKTLKMKFSKD